MEDFISEISEEEMSQTNLKMAISYRISILMEERNVSKKDLAKYLNQSPIFVDYILSGTFDFNITLLSKIFSFLGVDLSNKFL